MSFERIKKRVQLGELKLLSSYISTRSSNFQREITRYDLSLPPYKISLIHLATVAARKCYEGDHRLESAGDSNRG